MSRKRMKGTLKYAMRITLVLVLSLLLTNVWADSGAQHQQRQSRPIQLGTSGGNINDQFLFFCCSGTLGALVEDANGTQFILSNNHVMALSNHASFGDDISQPGLVDASCLVTANDIVADLSDFVPIGFGSTNLVDAAIAQVRPGQVDASGAIFDIGPLSPETLAPFVGLAVKKSGRTTGFTLGQISAVDVTVDVGYADFCGGPASNVATFVNQFSVTPGGFSAGGDSGSLIVEDVSTNPRAVGLLFAGSNTITIGNPIDSVLSAFGVSMVGGTPTPGTTGSIAGTVINANGGMPISGAIVQASTGQSATSDVNGSYAISNVPIGTRTVIASAAGFDSQTQAATVDENQTTIVDFALNPRTTPTQAIVDCITYTTARGKPGKGKDLNITVSVIDDLGNPVVGASVIVNLNLNGSPFALGTGATDAAGEVTFEGRNYANACYSTDVLSLAASGLTFNGATPPNGFQKGVDPVPDADCRNGSDGCGETPFGTYAKRGPDLEKMGLAIAVKRQFEPMIMAMGGVVGMGVSVSADGTTPVIEVYLKAEDSKVTTGIPRLLAGVPVRTVVTGPIIAY